MKKKQRNGLRLKKFLIWLSVFLGSAGLLASLINAYISVNSIKEFELKYE